MPGILAEIAGRIATFLAFDGDDFYNVLCDTDGHLQIDVLSTVMDVAAATAANQATIITAVQSLQNLVGALHDVNLDELDVNVESSVLPTNAATSPNQATIITTLQSLQNLVGALHDVGVDELDVNIDYSVLPEGAATETTLGLVKDRIGALTTPTGGSTNKLLTDALTALQLIDNLYGALQSENTDALQVRGSDQLFSFQDVLPYLYVGNPSGANGYVESPAVTAGQIWHITAICIRDDDRLLTKIEYVFQRAAAEYTFDVNPTGVAAAIWYPVKSDVWLISGDTIRVYCIGCQAADTMRFHFLGDRMTLET